MRTSIFAVILFMSLSLSNFILAQDYTKMNQLQAQFQTLMQQMQVHQNDPVKMEQLSTQFEKLTKELEQEALKLQQEINPDGTTGGSSGNADEIIAQQKAIVDSLPPILKKIHKLHCDIVDMEPTEDYIKMNAASEEIIQLMGEIYSGKEKLNYNEKSFVVSLEFGNETNVLLEMKGKGSDPELFDVEYHFKVPLKGVLVADYMVDVIQQRGYLLGYSVFTSASETNPETVNVLKLSGWKNVIRIGQGVTKGPIDKYAFEPGLSGVTIGPSKNKSVDYYNAQTWPDEIVDEYMVGYTAPFITFLSSMDQFTEFGLPIPCGASINMLTYITPEELNSGIKKGTYTKVITKDTGFPGCTESTVTITVEIPNLICDEQGEKGAVATSGACIDHGGFVLATEDDVFIKGQPVARVGDKVLCLRHGVTEIVGDKNVEVYSEKQRIARVGDKTKCGAVIKGGSFNVYAGSKK